MGQWKPGGIKAIIRNETYKGIHCWGKRQTVWDPERKLNPRTGKPKKSLKPVPRKDWEERIVPPIVGNELWARANAALDRNQRKAMAHGRDFLLSLLITCKECERNFMGVTAKQPSGSEIRYYRCVHRYGFDEPYSCLSSRTVRAQKLENSVWAFVKKYLTMANSRNHAGIGV